MNNHLKPPIIFIAGHKGMVGSSIFRELESKNNCILITRSKEELDLRNQHAVDCFFAENKIDQVYLAAAKVGGIIANNNYPADFILENLQIECNIINAANKAGVDKLLFLGSSCIYPKLAPQPIKEEYLLTNTLEPTNEPYAIAKIAGIKMCESVNRQYGRDYRCLMPTNLYGPGDNYHPENSHVLPALLRRFHEAKIKQSLSVTVWGTGTPRREFLHVDDLAQAAVHVMNMSQNSWHAITTPTCSHVNVGTGKDMTIKALATLIADIVGFKGEIIFDNTKPDGTPRKLLDISKLISTGWQPKIVLEHELSHTYTQFLSMYGNSHQNNANRL
jgi:GDP-L-fucose synthase